MIGEQARTQLGDQLTRAHLARIIVRVRSRRAERRLDCASAGPGEAPFTNGRDARRTQWDWAGSGRSYDKAVDLVLDDFESTGLEDVLLQQVAAGRGC